MICEKCGQETNSLKFLKERLGWCPSCFYAAEVPTSSSPMIAIDSIPGGLDIRHGICNEDGTPKRYYSKSEIKQAAFEAGYFVGDDTPKINPRISEERRAQEEKRRQNR